MADATRVLFLGLDACDHRIVEHLVAHGRCRNLAGLLQGAAVVPTVAPYGSFVGSTWMTFATGCRVGTHRYYNWVEYQRTDYQNRDTSPTEALRPPFWLQLSDADQRVALLDVPHSQLPPADFNGVLLKEWGAHDRHHGLGAHPASLLEELGPHPYGSRPADGDRDQFAPCDYTLRDAAVRTIEEERQLYNLIVAGVQAKREASTRVLAQGGWDLFASVIGETHCVGHQLWHVHDQDHPRHDPSTRILLSDPVEDVYDRVDAVVGDHLRLVDDDTAIYVHLSHGMQAHHDGDHLLDVVLDRLDRPTSVGLRTQASRMLLSRAPHRLRPSLTKVSAAALRHRMGRQPPAPPPPVRWRAQRRFFQVPNNTVVGGIRFNLVGREPEGLVPPRDVAALTERLTESLLEVVNVDTGRPAVRAVVSADEVLERSPDDAFPDLFLEWDRSQPVERVWSPRIGTIEVPYDHWRTGDHTDRGLLLVRAPGVRPGTRRAPMPLEDIAPTLVASLGLELERVDGRPRPDLVPAGANRAKGPSSPVPLTLTPDHQPARPRSRAADERLLARGAVQVAGAAAHRSEVALHGVDLLGRRLDQLDVALDRLGATQQSLARTEQVLSTMRWLERCSVADDHLISVLTPTFNRPEALRRAVGSVLAQRYRRWELVVIDDGSDTAKEVVADIGDDRVRAIEVDHLGPAAARNAGLDAAAGSLVAYLDDDNTLDPGWLAAVAWAFSSHPERDVLYGARMVDDDVRVYGNDTGGWPWLQLNPFDHDRLREGNIADMGVIAHRSGLPEARFDERLWEFADWDFFLAITEHRPPLMLPAIALYYRTDGDERLSGTSIEDFNRVREKWRR